MKVAIVEICEANHYSAVEALALTYAYDSKNQISVYTLAGFETLDSLENYSNISVVKKEYGQSIHQFLKQINDGDFDAIHLNTVSKYYSQFANIGWKNLIITIHNIDTWFDNPLNKQFSLLKYRLNNTKGGIKRAVYLPVKYFVREYQWQKRRVKMVDAIVRRKQNVLVYSDNQKEYLSRYLAPNQIIVFPFCVHQPSDDLSVNNKLLRICIPGSVDNHRRDYNGLFQILKQHHQTYAHRVCIDLLGYIPKSESHIIPKINELQELGIQIIYNRDFIDETTYNQRLRLCDVILGNLKPRLNQQSKYGETKETGVIFNMIKAGKPGVFPDSYPIDKNLKPICLRYDKDLHPLLSSLLKDNTQIYALKKRALEVAKWYEPANLYPQLVKQLNN